MKGLKSKFTYVELYMYREKIQDRYEMICKNNAEEIFQFSNIVIPVFSGFIVTVFYFNINHFLPKQIEDMNSSRY